MSYSNTLVPIPSKPFKITRKPLPSGSYVYLETGRKYNSEAQHTVPVRKTIGKLEDSYTGKSVAELQSATHMYPNSNYVTYILNNEIPDEPEQSAETEDSKDCVRSSCLHLGAYVVIKHLFEITGIRKILRDILQENAGLFMDLASYSIICESNVAQHYPDYCYNHPLFTNDMRVYSDSTISRFLHKITIDHSIQFQDQWNEKRDKKIEILLSYDSTNKNTKAGCIEKAELSKAAKENPNVPMVNYAVAYDVTNYDPLFYENYPGSNPDVGQLEYTIERSKAYGYENITMILDRGYFSEMNIRCIEEAGYSFIIMAKGKSKFIKEAISHVKGSFENDRSCYNDRFHVYGKTYEGKLYASDTSNRCFHVFYHDIDGAVEREKTNQYIGKCRKALDKLIDKQFKVKPSFRDYERYFETVFEPIPAKDSNKGRKKGKESIHREAKNPPPQYILKSYCEKTEAINEEYTTHGYFTVVTDRNMTADQAITRYKGRDCSEKLFLSDKSFLGNSAYRVYCDESEEAKTFIEFVASIIRNRMFHLLDDAIPENESKSNRMTVPAAIGELEKIEIIRTNGHPYCLDHAVTATQKVILHALGLNENDVKKEIEAINLVLL